MTSGDKWLDEVQRRQFERLIVHEEAHIVTLREQIANLNAARPAMAATAAAVKIPVFGNGGVADAAGARAMLEAGCAGVAVGRAAVFNPMIFREIAAGLAGAPASALASQERIKLFVRFLELSAGIYGEERGLARARKLVGYWLKGLPNASGARASFMTLKTLKEARTMP